MSLKGRAFWLRAVWLEHRETFKAIVIHIAFPLILSGMALGVERLVGLFGSPYNERAIIEMTASVLKKLVVVLLSVSTLIVIFTAIIRFWLRTSSQVKKLKQGLRDTFIRELDDSSLNPKRQIGENHV